jgi:hypothetical protein
MSNSHSVTYINSKSGLKNCYTCLNSISTTTKGKTNFWSDDKQTCSATKTDDTFYDITDSRGKKCDKPNQHNVDDINPSSVLKNCYTCLNSGKVEDGYWWSDDKKLCSTTQTDSSYYNKVSANTPYTATSCAKPDDYNYIVHECSTNTNCLNPKYGEAGQDAYGKCLFNGDFNNPVNKCYFPCSSNADCTVTGEKCTKEPGISTKSYCKVPTTSGTRTCSTLGVQSTCNTGEICRSSWNGAKICGSATALDSYDRWTNDYTSGTGANSGDTSWYNNYDTQLEKNQEFVEKLLDDIQKLQDLENSLLSTLETSAFTADEKKSLLEKINSISDMRNNLYASLNNINGYYDTLNSSADSSITDQSSAIKIIEEQLNKTKMSLMDYEKDKNNKLRLIEVNSYYSQRYSEHSKMMKIVIYTLAPIIMLSIINNAGFIPYNVFILLVIIISVYGGVLFFNTLISTWSRDSINYQEYLWSFNRSSAPAPVAGSNSNPWALPNLGTCVGSKCCSSDTYYDTETNTCKKNTN